MPEPTTLERVAPLRTITAPPPDIIARAQKYRRPVTMTLKPGDVLGTAVFEGYRRTHSLEWHHKRSTGIGGSDVAAIVGVSKWTSAYTLWSYRTGAVDRYDEEQNAAAKRWGQKLERVVMEEYAEQHPELVVITWPDGVGASFRHRDRDYQLASPDALLYWPETGEWGILEVKTARYEYDWQDPVLFLPTVPPYYLTQGQWYVDAFGFTRLEFAVLFSGSKYQEFPVEPDTFEQRVNRDRVVEFLELVETKTPPSWDGHDSTYETVRRIHPEIDRDTETELGAEGEYLLDAKRALLAAEAEWNKARSMVLAEMGRDHHAIWEGRRIASRQSKQGGVPFLALKIRDLG